MNTGNRKLDVSGVKIQPMVSDYIDSIFKIWWVDIPQKEMLASQLGGLQDLSLIAEYEGILVGFLLGRAIYAGLPPIKGVGVIFYIAVKPDYQKYGIGAKLINALKKNCKTKKIDTVRALVPENATETKKYFEKVGFHPSNIINYDSPVS